MSKWPGSVAAHRKQRTKEAWEEMQAWKMQPIAAGVKQQLLSPNKIAAEQNSSESSRVLCGRLTVIKWSLRFPIFSCEGPGVGLREADWNWGRTLLQPGQVVSLCLSEESLLQPWQGNPEALRLIKKIQIQQPAAAWAHQLTGNLSTLPNNPGMLCETGH